MFQKEKKIRLKLIVCRQHVLVTCTLIGISIKLRSVKTTFLIYKSCGKEFAGCYEEQITKLKIRTRIFIKIINIFLNNFVLDYLFFFIILIISIWHYL